MKWFKHMSDTIDNPKIQELLDRWGAKGYFWYFGTIEFLAREDALDSPAETTIAYLSRKFRTKPEQLLGFYRAETALLSHSFEKESGRIKLFCDKMAEIKDNYTKDKKKVLQESCKKLSLEVEVEAEKEEDKEKETTSEPNIVAVWCEEYKSQFGVNYSVTGQDAKLLQVYKNDKDIRNMFKYFFSHPNWAKDYKVSIFKTEYNKIKREMADKDKAVLKSFGGKRL